MQPYSSARIWLRFATLQLLVLGTLLRRAGAGSSQGTEFVVLFQQATGGENALYVTSDSDTQASVSVTFGSKEVKVIQVSRSSSVRLPVPSGMQMEGTKESADFTIYLNASSPVSVFADYEDHWSADATLVLPIPELGRQYVLSTYIPADRDMAQGVVVATEDNTTVQLYRGGLPLTSVPDPILLRRFHAFQLQSNEDLMGTRVVADKPVAIFSGNIKTTLVHMSGTHDHLYSQLIPESSWGSFYVTFPTTTANRDDEDTYRVVASKANTKVKVIGQTEFTLTQAVQWRQVKLSAHGLYVITSDNPVMVVKFVSGTSAESHPCMTPIVAADQWSSSYTFMTPSSSSNRISSDIWILSYSNETAFIRVNGADATTMGAFECSLNVHDLDGREVKACSRRFSPNSNVLLTSRPAVPFGAYVISFGSSVASCHALGMNLDADAEAGVTSSSPAVHNTETAQALEATSASWSSPSSPSPEPTPTISLSPSPVAQPSPTAATSGLTAATSGPTAATSGPTAATSGQTAATSGPTAATSGSTAATSRPTAATSGPTVATSGLTAATSGPTAATSGPTAATSRPTADTSGSTAATSRPTAATSGPTVATSGLTAATSGPTAATSGPTAATSGPTAATSGPTAAPSGPTDATSGPTDATSGPTAATSGLSAATSGPTDATSGPTDATSGPTNATSGLTAATSDPTDATYGLTAATSGLTDVTSGLTAATSGLTAASQGTPVVATTSSLPDLPVTSLQSTVLPSSGPKCSCTLRCHYNVTRMTSLEALSSVVERLQSELAVDSRNVSASLRKVTSAPDRRVSSQAVGYVAVGIIVLIFTVIVLLDLPKLTRDIVQAVKRKPE